VFRGELRRGPPNGGPLAICSEACPPPTRASRLGRLRVTARLMCCDDAAGARPLASCRTALATAPRRDAGRVRARPAAGDEGGAPRGRRRGRAAAARQRAWRRRRPGRRRAGRSRARSAWPAGDLRWGRTCVRKATTPAGRMRAEHTFASAFGSAEPKSALDPAPDLARAAPPAPPRAPALHRRAQRRPDVELGPDAPDDVVGELRRPGVAAEIRGPHARRRRLEHRLVDRA
jgi:hypothetical protein